MTKPRAVWVLWVRYSDTRKKYRGWCEAFSVTPVDWYQMTGKKIIQEYIDGGGWHGEYCILPAGRTPRGIKK